MATNGRPTLNKRMRERQRQQKIRDKEDRRRDRKRDKDRKADAPDGVDPDIAGIVPGPQPIPWLDQVDPSDDDS